jgi:hypothetical protein
MNSPGRTAFDRAKVSRATLLRLAPAVALGALLLWVYWPTLGDVVYRWWHDPQYNHGFLVPVFAGVLLWLRRGRPAPGRRLLLLQLARGPVPPAPGGRPDRPVRRPRRAAVVLARRRLPFLHAAAAPPPARGPGPAHATARHAGQHVRAADRRLLRGRGRHRHPPERGQTERRAGLQRAEQRPLRDKVAILLSAAPVALVTNVVRITATGVLHKTVGSEVANAVFHDLAGWLMMPLARPGPAGRPKGRRPRARLEVAAQARARARLTRSPE